MVTYSAEAEQACARVMGELAKHRTLESALAAGPRSRLISGRNVLSHRYSPVVGMISVIDDFSIGALRLRLDEALVGNTVVVESARLALAREIERSWPDRIKRLQRWFEVSVDGFSPLDGVLAFVEVRNAIAHGLGRLTRRQLGSDGGEQVRQKISIVGVRESGGQLIVGSDSIWLCAICCKASIIAWDEAARRGALRQNPIPT